MKRYKQGILFEIGVEVPYRYNKDCYHVTMIGRKRAKVTVAVFSGSLAPSEEHRELASALGAGLARNGYRLVNGGGPGLMEVVAKHVYSAGGYVLGVHFEHEKREKSDYNTETITHTDLYKRQKDIVTFGDCYVSLPGGLGTLYETIEIITFKSIDKVDKSKPLILVGKEFWSPFEETIERIVKVGYIHSNVKNLYTIVNSVDEVLTILEAYKESIQ